MKECLLNDSLAIKKAAENLQKNVCDQALFALNQTFENKGKLLVSGVGKSGIVARKIAATFTSLGFPALFLNPTDALHGDLGVAMQYDTAIFLSNSGETKEIIDLLPYIKRRISKIISISSFSDSSLVQSSDLNLDSSIDRESCPLNLAPTTSTTLSLAIGDALAAQWSLSRGITHKTFALNHPAGNLGKRLTLTVENVMINLSDLPSVLETCTIKSVVLAITSNLKRKISVGFAWVRNKDNIFCGIITDGDLRRALLNHPSSDWDKILAIDICTKSPKTIGKDELAIIALEKMKSNNPGSINNLGVLNSNKIIGFITIYDIIKMGLNED